MNNCVNEIRELETLFSSNEYDGAGTSAFVIEEGTIPIMVSAPHAVNQYREGQRKWADRYTGGIARYLREVTGCHVIYSCMYTQSDPNYDQPGINQYQGELLSYLQERPIYLLLDLHGASARREYAVEMGTAPDPQEVADDTAQGDPSLHRYQFVDDDIRAILERRFAQLPLEHRDVWKNIVFGGGGQNTVTKFISGHSGTACIQLEVNANYRDPEQAEAMTCLVEGLVEIIEHFAAIDWEHV